MTPERKTELIKEGNQIRGLLLVITLAIVCYFVYNAYTKDWKMFFACGGLITFLLVMGYMVRRRIEKLQKELTT